MAANKAVSFSKVEEKVFARDKHIFTAAHTARQSVSEGQPLVLALDDRPLKFLSPNSA
jgi:hypothetical protein